MTHAADVVVDVAILGGGIAGLWLLDRLRNEGYSVALFEADRLGAGQSVASQGIIHGGAKYTFGFAFDSAVRELREMPTTWRNSLEGSTMPDLSRARVLSSRTCMWVPRQVGGGILGAFSRVVMRSRVRSLPRSEWPDGLRSQEVLGSVYSLDEVVLDVPTVLGALQGAHRELIRKLPDRDGLTFDAAHGRMQVGDLSVSAQRFVLAAGAGNEALLDRAGIGDVAYQRRPLHQVVVSGMKHALYAHCVGRSTRPLATVTAHPSGHGDFVWNVGGLIAEDGVAESEAELVRRARRDLPRLLPAADFGNARWATFRIDRAEGAAAGGYRPGAPIVETRGRYVVAWPTKLALAPALAERVVRQLQNQQVRPGPSQLDALAALSEPEVARPPWEAIAAWS